MFVPKEGGTVAIFMYYWIDSENIHALLVLANLWVVLCFMWGAHTRSTFARSNLDQLLQYQLLMKSTTVRSTFMKLTLT